MSRTVWARLRARRRPLPSRIRPGVMAEHLETRIALDAASAATVQWQVSPAQWGNGPSGGDLLWGGANVSRSSGPNAYASELAALRAQYGVTGAGQTVAVIDTGIAYDHYALGGGLGSSYRVVGGWDFTEENDADPYDDGPAGFHGTHVAGIIGSSDASFTGIAPEVDFVGIRVFNDNGLGSFQWVEQALRWVHTHRADFEFPITTVNMSLGTAWNSLDVPGWSQLEDELALLEADGIMVIASAGNNYRKDPRVGLNYPAASPHVYAAASVGLDGTLSPFSQRANRVLAAPGEEIVSTVPDYLFNFNGITDDFAAATGTSMSAPFVSGASVLVRQAMQLAGWTEITPLTIANHLHQTADILVDAATGVSVSRINLRRALETLAVPAQAPPVDAVPSPPPASPTPPQELAAQDLGPVSQNVWSLSAGPQGTRYTMTATRTGWLTLEWLQGLTTSATLRDSQGRDLAQFSTTTAPQRFDLFVTAGETLELRLASSLTSGSDPVRATNLVQQVDQRWHVTGTPEVDQIELDTWHQSMTVNQVTYQLGTDAEVQLVDWHDEDTALVITGGAENQADATPRQLQIDSSNGSHVSVRGYTHLRLQSNGALDHIRLAGSPAADQLWMQARTAQLQGLGYSIHAAGFSVIEVDGGGGHDSLTWDDTAERDMVTSRPTQSEFQGNGYQSIARGFDQQTLRSVHGGGDWAFLHGSENDDHFRAAPGHSLLVSGRREVVVTDFARVYGQAGPGGTDRAELIGSDRADQYLANEAYGWMHGADYLHLAQGFGEVIANGGGGADQATLFGSDGDDHFRSSGTQSQLALRGVQHTVQDFRQVTAEAGAGGVDLFELADETATVRQLDAATLELVAGAVQVRAKNFQLPKNTSDQRPPAGPQRNDVTESTPTTSGFGSQLARSRTRSARKL